jgi:hypothetical protein
MKLALSTLLGSLAQVSACTVCNTETGRQVRDGVFGHDFGTTLIAVWAPFPILLAIVGAVLWGPDYIGKRRKN